MSESKGRGRPSKADEEPSEPQATKRTASAALPESKAPAAKRGRGRPPKGKKRKGPYVKKNDPMGRGRPPKNAPKKTAEKA